MLIIYNIVSLCASSDWAVFLRISVSYCVSKHKPLSEQSMPRKERSGKKKRAIVLNMGNYENYLFSRIPVLHKFRHKLTVTGKMGLIKFNIYPLFKRSQSAQKDLLTWVTACNYWELSPSCQCEQLSVWGVLANTIGRKSTRMGKNGLKFSLFMDY